MLTQKVIIVVSVDVLQDDTFIPVGLLIIQREHQENKSVKMLQTFL